MEKTQEEVHDLSESMEKTRYKGLVSIFSNRILNTIIQMGNLKEKGKLILDFGSGSGELKRRLDSCKIINYDIITKYTDVKNYTKIKSDIIVCNGVLEHLKRIKDLNEVLGNFKKMNPDCKLIVRLPTENSLSKVFMFLLQRQSHIDHHLKLKEINNVIEDYCNLENRKIIFTMAEISLYTFKK